MPRPRRHDLEKLVGEAYRSGETLASIANRLGISPPTACRYLKTQSVEARHGYPGRPGRKVPNLKNRTLAPEVEAQVVAAYQAGKGLTACSEEFKVGIATVWNALKRAGVARRQGANRRLAVNERYFSEVVSEEAAWILGLITADGCVYQRKGEPKGLIIALKQSDRYILEKIRDILQAEHPVIDREHLSPNGKLCFKSTLKISSVLMAADLVRLGVTPRKTFTATPWNGPGHLLRHYYRGLVCGDGCLNIKSLSRDFPNFRLNLAGTLEITQGFANFIESSLGFKANPRPVKSIFVVTYSGRRRAAAVAELLYGNAAIFLDRKKALADQFVAHVAANPVKMPNLSLITREEFVELRSRYGTWKAVARHIDCDKNHLSTRINELGLGGMKADFNKRHDCRPLKGVTVEMLSKLYVDHHESWNAVARALDVTASALQFARRRLGMPVPPRLS